MQRFDTAQFRQVVARMTTTDAAAFLKAIEVRERDLHDVAREIIWQTHPTLAPKIRPADIELQDAEQRAEQLRELAQLADMYLQRLQANAELIQQLQAQQANAVYTPYGVYQYEQAQRTGAQKGILLVVLCVLLTWSIAHYFGAAIAAALGVALRFAVAAFGAAAGAFGVFVILSSLLGKKSEAAQECTQGTIIINQTVIVNSGKIETND